MDIDIAKNAAGPIGALSAMLFMKGPLMQRVGMLLPGAALAWYGAKPLSQYANLPEGLAGFLLGLFGMALIAKVLDTLEKFPLGDLIQSFLSKFTGGNK